MDGLFVNPRSGPFPLQMILLHVAYPTSSTPSRTVTLTCALAGVPEVDAERILRVGDLIDLLREVPGIVEEGEVGARGRGGAPGAAAVLLGVAGRVVVSTAREQRVLVRGPPRRRNQGA